MNDKTAIDRLKRGDINGLASLVERYGTQAVRTAFLITRDRDVAEDVVQSAFLRVYHRVDGFDTARPFGPWFMRIVVNAAIRAAQRRERVSSLDAPVPHTDEELTFVDLLPDPAPSPDAAYEFAELREAVWDALSQLSPEQRATVVMRYYLDLSDSEISGELDIAASTVRGRLRTARQRLRGYLMDSMGTKTLRKWQGGEHE